MEIHLLTLAASCLLVLAFFAEAVGQLNVNRAYCQKCVAFSRTPVVSGRSPVMEQLKKGVARQREQGRPR
jgi:hypothetical protein